MTTFDTTTPTIKRSPWGSVDHQAHLADGIDMVSTPGHGGVKLDRRRNALMPEALRLPGGWYEEDCDVERVVAIFPEAFITERRPDVDAVREAALAGVRAWAPDAYEAWTGEKVTADQSNIVADREFLAAHADDFVTVAAWGSWHETVPAGMVGVLAYRGGREGQRRHTEKRYLLVPQGAYDVRDPRGFVIDDPDCVEWVDPA